MKKVMLIPFIATGALLGCQDTNQTQAKDKAALEHEMQKPLWAGSYSGTTPCMSCASRCEDCPGMAIDLVLNQDQTYELRRESLSGHNAVEVLKGRMHFKDTQQTQLELLNVKTRNLIWVDIESQMLEIREDQTAQPYVAQDDFLLERT
jgi:uncharacterized lipoprotein NlpE involved in copper resistance